MTRDDIFRMAHEVGLKTPWDLMEYQWKFAALVAAAEREACAKICDKIPALAINQAKAAAKQIRARGGK
jgi:hypothetical protein